MENSCLNSPNELLIRASNAKGKSNNRIKRDEEVMGYLTITIDSLHGILAYGNNVPYSSCDILSECDPYVVLYVNGQEVLRSEVYDGTRDVRNMNLTYKSGKISKDSEIVIEMWDDDSNHPDLMLQSRGDVYVFLHNGHRQDKQVHQNYVDTHSSWQDA